MEGKTRSNAPIPGSMGKSVLIPLREGTGERVDNAAQGLARPRSERHRCYFC